MGSFILGLHVGCRWEIMGGTRYLLLMPILAISWPLGEEDPHEARNARSAQQAFQTNFAQFGEVKDSGSLLRSGTLGLEQLRRLKAHPSFSTDVQLQNPDLFPEMRLQTSARTTNPVRFPNPLDEDQLLLSVEPFPEESLANKNSFDIKPRLRENTNLFGQ